jgi:uncharacterized protein (DUF1810 family)
VAPDFNLQRFVTAQNPVFEQVCAELRQGTKRSHWMWFIFPQLNGLGRSSMAEMFAISGAPEAEAYLKHRVLGPRLSACTSLVNGVKGRSIGQIFGFPDDLKFHSSMTLFAEVAAAENHVFKAALDKYFVGKVDERTIELLRHSKP